MLKTVGVIALVIAVVLVGWMLVRNRGDRETLGDNESSANSPNEK